MSFRVDRGRSVLEGHRRKKKKIFPPFAGLPFTQTSFTADIFPELLWLALILDRYGYRQGIEIAVPFQETLYKQDKTRPWYRTSEIAEISPEFWSGLQESSRPFKAEIEKSLLPIACTYPTLKMNFIESRDPVSLDVVDLLKRCVGRFSNRFETPGCALIGSVVFLQAFVGRIQVPREMLEGINAIVGKPGSEEAELASSTVRAALLAMWPVDGPHPSDWPKVFWRTNRLISACEVKSGDA